MMFRHQGDYGCARIESDGDTQGYQVILMVKIKVTGGFTVPRFGAQV
jgi:hypothetical protein